MAPHRPPTAVKAPAHQFPFSMPCPGNCLTVSNMDTVFVLGVPILCILCFSAVQSTAADMTTSAIVSLVSTEVISTLQPTYASWNIDSSCNRGFHHTNFSNPNLVAAASGLYPSRLRFGGSGNDYLVYGLSPGSPECAALTPERCSYFTSGCLNSSHWEELYSLAQQSRSDFIFGLSFGLAQGCAEGAAYKWNSTNAASLLAYLNTHGQALYGFELGNEINNCLSGTAKGYGTCNIDDKPCPIAAKQQADALVDLANMLSHALPNAVVIGPDTGGASPKEWLEALLPLVQSAKLHAVTHHVYNGISRTTFNSSKQLDSPLPEISWYTSVLSQLAPTAQVWAGENGPTGGGDDGTCGTHSVCGTFASTLWYADDMALRAKHGFVQYQRQDLFGGAYGLTNSLDSNMALGATEAVVIRPDYWTNFLWKRLLGPNMLNATSSSATVRAYAFTGSPASPYAAPECGASTSTLQLLLVNLAGTPMQVSLPSPPSRRLQTPLGSPPAPAHLSPASNYAAWTLSPAEQDPFSQIALLNGSPLPLTVDRSQVDPAAFLRGIVQPPVRHPVQDGILLAPLSTSFVCYY